MAYPLQALLLVRNVREHNAKTALHAAQQALHDAQTQAQHARKELERYQLWLPEEKDRRYNAVMGQELTLEDLDTFKAGLAKLDEGVLLRESAVFEADKIVEQHKLYVQSAHDALLAAYKEKLKIESHQEVWLREDAQQAERAADLEMEEFSSGVILQALGYEDDQP